MLEDILNHSRNRVFAQKLVVKGRNIYELIGVEGRFPPIKVGNVRVGCIRCRLKKERATSGWENILRKAASWGK
jgi:hypothetical protein